MDEILELAGQLGKKIAADPRGGRMAAARKAIEDSLTDRQLLADYETQQMKLQELEMNGRPIEPEDKRRMADLHNKVIGSPVIKELLKAQADYVELMSLVNHRIEGEIMGLAGESY